ncbi:MAG: histidinol-phosphate transaminase, partial [Magnetococcales bacterium]|nr:histidinol-phosphate transaminase [Magnetococcales bacterium]
MKAPSQVRKAIREMAGYAPGEQPKGRLRKILKLNTNENPFPPPEPVLEALREAIGSDLRLYPEPTSLPVRQAAARAYGVDVDQVVVGNGSDDVLTMT